MCVCVCNGGSFNADSQGNTFLAQWNKAFQLHSGVTLIDLLTGTEVKCPFVAPALDAKMLLT